MKHLKVFFAAVIMMFWSATSLGGTATLIADTKSGFILSSRNANVKNYPASLTKVMTLYMAFEALEEGLLKMDDKLPVSVKASRQPKSKMYLKAGSTITVEEAIMALIIKSANDAAVVLAESLAPSEEEFAVMMTKTARELGMDSTTFKNASGLHHPDQKTTARDMAVMTMALINHHPEYYKLFSKKSFKFKFNGKTINSHNEIVRSYKGGEGLKTGFISAAGYNIISTAKRGDNRLVSVVLGYNSTRARDKKAVSLLNKGFKMIIKQKSLASKSGKALKNNPLGKNALISKPNKQSYLPIMAKSIQDTKNIVLASSQTPTDDRVLGVGYLDVEDFTTTGQGDGAKTWAIQVGAFHSQKLALRVANEAVATLRLKDKTVKTPQAEEWFRSRIFGFENKKEADNACQKLLSQKMQCMSIAPVS
ncbi:MAG: D-alanyl-D-alanine carboxypeptidase [Alphaproteobacteria bacterium]|nr:D-alanyl-D-alanine carboxypeptidase [Alphaproteobacteria bacterium]